MEIRALRADDDRSPFRSGDDDIDRFFHRFAGQNQFRLHIGSTYVAVDGPVIVGYVTVSPGAVEVERLPAAERKRLPHYPLPILRLARLGVDASAQGRGVGAELMRFVAELALRMAQDYGCVGILVDAKADAVSFYERYGFFPLEVMEGQAASRPTPLPMFLSIGTIARAAGGDQTHG